MNECKYCWWANLLISLGISILIYIVDVFTSFLHLNLSNFDALIFFFVIWLILNQSDMLFKKRRRTLRRK